MKRIRKIFNTDYIFNIPDGNIYKVKSIFQRDGNIVYEMRDVVDYSNTFEVTDKQFKEFFRAIKNSNMVTIA